MYLKFEVTVMLLIEEVRSLVASEPVLALPLGKLLASAINDLLEAVNENEEFEGEPEYVVRGIIDYALVSIADSHVLKLNQFQIGVPEYLLRQSSAAKSILIQRNERKAG